MLKFETNDINDLLRKWDETKKEISELEKRLDKYKIFAENILSESETNIINTGTFTLKKKIIKKEILSRNDVPLEIFKKYSKTTSYPVFYVSKNIGDKPKRIRKSAK